MDSTRFNELRRGITHISPALLSKRLDSMGDKSQLVRKRTVGQKGYECFPTQACKELLPIIISLGNLGSPGQNRTPQSGTMT